MSAIKDGGHAFPVLQYTRDGYVVLASGGMTLRDYFAAKVLCGITASMSDNDMREMLVQKAFNCHCVRNLSRLDGRSWSLK